MSIKDCVLSKMRDSFFNSFYYHEMCCAFSVLTTPCVEISVHCVFFFCCCFLTLWRWSCVWRNIKRYVLFFIFLFFFFIFYLFFIFSLLLFFFFSFISFYLIIYFFYQITWPYASILFPLFFIFLFIFLFYFLLFLFILFFIFLRRC